MAADKPRPLLQNSLIWENTPSYQIVIIHNLFHTLSLSIAV